MAFQTDNTMITNREMATELVKASVRETLRLPLTAARFVYRLTTRR
ncbi:MULTISPECIES: hypothetical protein [Rhodobacterales]|nr:MULTISPECIES: hypothetical protein [Rhodobacterales]MDO6588754.1 hypothetical protein [Yoonia sp. 1_MG-2023]